MDGTLTFLSGPGMDHQIHGPCWSAGLLFTRLPDDSPLPPPSSPPCLPPPSSPPCRRLQVEEKRQEKEENDRIGRINHMAMQVEVLPAGVGQCG